MQQETQNAIALRSAPTAISTLSAARQDFEQALRLAIQPDDRDLAAQRSLMVIAEIRQASVSAETLRLFGRALRAYESEDIQAAVLHYKRVPREQGETAMPDLPSLEAVIRKCRHERRGLAEQQRRDEEEQASRKRAEADRGKPLTDDPAMAATLERLNHRISLNRSLAEGDRQRLRETLLKSTGAIERETCTKCALMDDLSPAELRALADQREKRAQRLQEQTTEEAA